MKHGIFLFPFFLAAIFMSSCHHRPTMREMGIVLDTIQAESSSPLLDSLATPNCHVDINMIVFSNKEYSPLNDSLLRSGILSPEYLSLSTKHIPPRAAVDSFIKRYEADYHTFYRGIFTEEGDSAQASIGYKLSTTIEEGKDSVLNYRAFITFRQGTVETSYTHCKNIDMGKLRILSLDDIFVHGYEKALSEVILNRLLKQSANKSLEDLHQAGFFINSEVYPTSNFILGEKAITFVYVAGEIADRSKGEIQVEIKNSDIKRLFVR